jgi:hypothetical protein
VRSLLAFVLCAAALFCTASFAKAADTPLTVTFGGYTSTGANAQSGSSAASAYEAAGLYYIPKSQPASQAVQIGAYFDVLGFGGSGSGTSGGFGVAARTRGRGYLGAGAGAYSVTITPPEACPVSSALPGACTPVSYSATGFGGKVFAGISPASNVQFEVTYHFMPAAMGINTNAVSAEVGVRI